MKAVWEPIVSVEKWERVQELVGRNNKTRANNTVDNSQHTYLLTGLIYCAHCDCVLENGSGTGNKGQQLYFYYRHHNKRQLPDCPHPTSFPAEDMEEMVCGEILALLKRDEELVRMIAEQVSGQSAGMLAQINERIVFLDAELRRLDDEAQGLVKKIPMFAEVLVRSFCFAAPG